MFFNNEEKVNKLMNDKLDLIQRDIKARIGKLVYAIKAYLEDSKFVTLSRWTTDNITCTADYSYKNQIFFTFNYELLFYEYTYSQYGDQLNELIKQLREQKVCDVITNDSTINTKILMRFTRSDV